MKDLNYFKSKVIEILKKTENEGEEAKGMIKKSLDSMDSVYSLLNYETMGSIEKAGYGVGTIRIWRGKKYKKVSTNPTKWVRVYDKVDRGAKSSITRLINKADACNSIDELYQFCMSNHAIFKDANGVDLPILDELRKAVDEKKSRLERGDTSSIKPPKKEPKQKKQDEKPAKEEKEPEKESSKGEFSSLDDIKQAVRDGKKVYWKNEDYYVRKLGGLYIVQGKETSAGKLDDMFQDEVGNFFTKESKTESKEEKKEPETKVEEAKEEPKKEDKGEEKTPAADDPETVKAEIKKVEKLFDEYINRYYHGVGYWLRSERNADVHHKAFNRAKGIALLSKAKEDLEAEGYTMPEIPQMLFDKLAEYEKLNAEDKSYFKTAGDKTLSGIKQSVLDEVVESFKKPLQDKYKALKNQLPKAKELTKDDNPILKDKTNAEQAQLITEGTYNDKSYIFYNGKPYAPITGWGSIDYQHKMVYEAGMDPENQINYVKNEVSKDTMWSVASTLKRYGEKKLKELVKDAPMSDEEFNVKLLEKCTAEYKDYGYIYNQVYNHEYNKKVYETAKKMLDTINTSNDAINDIDLPVDPKDMEEAEGIIGRKVFSIANRSDSYGKSLYRAELKKMIEARIRNNPALARAMLVYIKNYQQENNTVIFTPKNEIWAQLPKLNENAMNSVMNGETETKGGTSAELYSGDGISSVVEDKDAGRYQVTFTGKPDYETRTILKQNGFRWAPSLGVWQCYNTANGERSLARVAEKLGWNKN